MAEIVLRNARLQRPTAEMVRKMAAKIGSTEDAARTYLERLRARTIEREEKDPFNFGYEPPVWFVVRAIIRGYEPRESDKKRVADETGLKWEDFTRRLRKRLGCPDGVAEVLIMGANRASKTDFTAKEVMRTCFRGKKSVNMGFQSLPTGKQVQMPRVWYYMPNEWKAKNIALKKADNTEEHISYTKQNGFSGSKITLGNGSDVRFISYKGDADASMEGSALDLCCLDEEFPKTYLEKARFRLASKRGTLILSFTPVSGFTPVVADFLSDIQVTRWHTAWMLPRDTKPPLPWNELGLTQNEYERLIAWRNEAKGGDIEIPESRPENCFEWVFDERSCDGIDNIPDGRAFERTPRFGVCRGGEAAVIWFYGRDNPYGTPSEVITKAAANKNSVKQIRCRVYGMAEQIKGRIFPEFKREKHVVKESEVPKDVFRIMVLDPAPERNWTVSWYAYHAATKVLYKYREWPGNYDIPGVGVPGPWAVPSDRKNGINDGDKGEGTEMFGFAYLNYKFEWARLERWKDYLEWLKTGHYESEKCEDLEEIGEWSEMSGAEEAMEFRVIDSRAGSQSKISMTSNATLFEDVSKLAEGFQPASGERIEVGVNVLHNMFATSKYKIVDTCKNTIFAYETYCGVDGQKGAVKDWIDQDRYAVLSGILNFTLEDKPRGTQIETERNGRERPRTRAKKSRIWFG